MDIDMLGRTSNEVNSIVAQIKDIIAEDVEPDGLVYHPDTIQAERITEDAEYEGIRLRFTGRLDSARVHMQIDVGFDDIVHPAPLESELPTILDSPAPRLLCYSRESAIAEKFEAMLKLGELNSRMKDFYDIWLLSRQFDFNGEELAEAIRLTFEHRGTELRGEMIPFQEDFITAKQVQWTAFVKRLPQANIPDNFEEIVIGLRSFLGPLVLALVSNRSIPARWVAPGPWE